MLKNIDSLTCRCTLHITQAGGQQGERYQLYESRLRTFLTDRVTVLDVNTTLGLLAAYGRTDDLIHYAAARQDYEGLLEHLMQPPGGAPRWVGRGWRQLPPWRPWPAYYTVPCT